MRYRVKGTGHVRSHFIGRWVSGYGRYMEFRQYLSTITRNQIVQERLKIIKFFDEFGHKATKEAFGYSRSTVYLWKKNYKDAKYNPSSLIPKSRRPKNVRRAEIDKRIVSFIRDMREKYPRLGKSKIKVLLDEYCAKEGFETISESAIGKVIKRNNFFFYRTSRIYHNPSGWQAERARSGKRVQKKKKRRISSRVKAKAPGEIVQLDTITRFDLGVKTYIITAVDLFSRFSFAYSYRSLSSRMALDFYQKLEEVSPFDIKSVKTDNGLEFLGEFDNYLERNNVTHYFSYPRTPQSNSYVERFNRTLQEEFVEINLEYVDNLHTFNDKLINYLLFFNSVRPHSSLKNQTPMGYLVSEHLVSNMCVTHTTSCSFETSLILCTRTCLLLC